MSSAGHAAESAERFVEGVAAAVRPRLRGWIHAGTCPLALAAGAVLVWLAPAGEPRIAGAIYVAASVLLFGVSAAYHRGTWSPRAFRLLRRLDHSNIYLLVAGTYTPFAVLALPPRDGAVLLAAVWSAAALGVLFRVLQPDAPRWLYVPLYFLLGWAAVFFLPELLTGAGPVAIGLLVLGGLLYTAGGVAYGLQRPDTWPGVWGHHEWFHAATVAAWSAHYVAVSIVVYRAG
jgi:hemolysin III